MESQESLTASRAREVSPPSPPLDVAVAGPAGEWTERTYERLAWAFVGLGVVLRIVRYAVNAPLWGDEAFVAANFIERGFGDLTRPLDYHQVCPLLFLWAELALVRLFGFWEASLRLFPTVCSIASVFLFHHVAGRVVRGAPRALAVAIFAMSFYPVRHGAEVKPYATDLLVALGLLALALQWSRAPERSRWLWALAAFAPVALAASHPAVFVAGGLSLAMLRPVWQTRRWPVRIAYAGFNLAVAVTFVALYLLVIRGQSEDAGDGTRAYWAGAFPPLQAPLKLAVWLLQVHTSHMFSYPIGGERGASAATTLCVVAGAVVLWRSRRRLVLAMLLAPFALGFAASALGRYPYGGSARTIQYVAPAICLLAGLGAAALLARLRRPGARVRGLRLGLVALAAVGIGPTVATVLEPYKMIEDHKAREFARWFWKARAADGELACVKRDLGTVFNRRHWELGRSAIYLCNQAIYSPRHHRGEPLRAERVSSERPLRCVLYNEEPVGTPAFRAWLETMDARYERGKVDRFTPVPKVNKRGLSVEDQFVVYEFVPRAGGPASPLAGRTADRR